MNDFADKYGAVFRRVAKARHPHILVEVIRTVGIPFDCYGRPTTKKDINAREFTPDQAFVGVRLHDPRHEQTLNLEEWQKLYDGLKRDCYSALFALGLQCMTHNYYGSIRGSRNGMLFYTLESEEVYERLPPVNAIPEGQGSSFCLLTEPDVSSPE